MPVSFYALSVQLSVLVSHHVIENSQEIGFTKGSKSGTESGYPFIGFQLVYYMLGTTSRLSMLLQVLREAFLVSGLTVTEQKCAETRLKKKHSK